jgi:hypothetical protein
MWMGPHGAGSERVPRHELGNPTPRTAFEVCIPSIPEERIGSLAAHMAEHPHQIGLSDVLDVTRPIATGPGTFLVQSAADLANSREGRALAEKAGDWIRHAGVSSAEAQEPPGLAQRLKDKAGIRNRDRCLRGL